MFDNEADTCRKHVLPKLYTAGWDDDQISEQKTFTDGRIVVAGSKCFRKKPKRADYLLRYKRDFTIAIVEAKASYRKPAMDCNRQGICRNARPEICVFNQWPWNS